MNKRLYRSKKEKMLAGVAGGIAEYYDVDPVLVRLAFVLLLLMNGIGLLIYIAAIFLVPVNPASPIYMDPTPESETAEGENTSNAELGDKKRNGKMIFGSILIILGTFLLIDDIFPTFDFSDVFPFVLILMGGWLLYPYLSAKKEIHS